MLICDTLNLVGVCAYDRKRHQKELEIAARNRLLGVNDKPCQFDSNGSKIGPNGQIEQNNYHVTRIVKNLQKKLPIGMLCDSPAQLTNVNEEDIQIVIDFEEE